LPHGSLTLHYDPRIVVQFDASRPELTSWDRWARIGTPTHVLRGTASDILTDAIVARMAASGPRPGVTGFEACGHAPTLSRPADAVLIRDRLAALWR
jgi:pimeloyl-ACP methyl ester carboxylesterase